MLDPRPRRGRGFHAGPARRARPTTTGSALARDEAHAQGQGLPALGMVERPSLLVGDVRREHLDALGRIRGEVGARYVADRPAHVALDDLLARPVPLDPAVVEPDRPAAELRDRAEVVADEDHGAPLAARTRTSSRGTSRRNRASPTASTSSTITMSGSTCAATANASRRYMPARVALERRVEEPLEPRELDDLVEAAVDVPPRHPEDRRR